MTTVLFACVRNAGRSQMAAVLFNQLADPARAHAISAGTDPGSAVHPEVVAAMLEQDVDLSAVKPRLLTDDLAGGAQWLVTMGCGNRCPVVPGARYEDWPLNDPHGQPLEEVRAIRDDIERLVAALIAREGWGDCPPMTGTVPGTASVASARPEDTAGILALLVSSHLPTEGLIDHLGTAIVARHDGRIVGCAALEIYADGALLRSVAVSPDFRGCGLGHRLTEAALARAAAQSLPAVYLLTTTAERFFPRFGFEVIGREDVPASVRQSVEFTSACPASATVMRRTLDQTIRPLRTA
jgi:arsenate reductase